MKKFIALTVIALALTGCAAKEEVVETVHQLVALNSRAEESHFERRTESRVGSYPHDSKMKADVRHISEIVQNVCARDASEHIHQPFSKHVKSWFDSQARCFRRLHEALITLRSICRVAYSNITVEVGN